MWPCFPRKNSFDTDAKCLEGVLLEVSTHGCITLGSDFHCLHQWEFLETERAG